MKKVDHEYPARIAHHPERGLEPDFTHHPSGDKPGGHHSRLWQPVRDRGYCAERFFSPARPTEKGWIWGAGPVFLIPTASDDLLGADKWGLGPTAVALRQDGRWTYGALVNHIWSVAGDDDRGDVNASFIQPFVSYTLPSAWTFNILTETTYDWKNEQESIPINGVVSKVVKIGNQTMSFAAGARYWAASPDNGPEGWGGRLVMTLMFPKGE